MRYSAQQASIYLNIQNVVPPEQLLKISFFVDTELQIPPIPQPQRYCFT